MRRPLVLLALLLAVPLAAQERQQQNPAEPVDAPALQAPAAPAQATAEAPAQKAPTLHVTQEQIDAQLRQDRVAAEDRQVGSQSWWYLVAAIAVGVVVALLVLD